MAILKRALIALGVLLLIPVVVIAAVFAYLTTAHGLSTLASLTSNYASSDDTKISVGDIEGSFPTDLTLRDVKLADRKGVWLTVDRARMVWSPLSLYGRKLVIDEIELGKVEVAREPDYEKKEEDVAPPDPNAPLFPELPIEIHLKRFALAELGLAEPVIGTPARLSATASATVRPPKEGVSAEFDVRRIDGSAGQFGGKARFVPATKGVEISLRGSEPQGGLIARLANIPGLPPIDVGMEGAGTLDALRTQLVVTAGDQGKIDGMAEIRREGDGRRVTLGLNGDVGRLVQPDVAGLVDGMTRVSAEAIVPDKGPIRIVDADVDLPAARLGARGEVDLDAETIDVAYDLKAGDAARFSKLLPGVKWTSLALRGTAKGPIDHPEIRADAEGGGLVAPQGSATTAKVVVTAKPDGSLSKDTTKVAATLAGEADGVTFAGDGLFSAGRKVAIAVDATSDLKGNADIRKADVSLAEAKASYVGAASPDAVKGVATIRAEDLSTLSALAGRSLAGSLDLAADLDVAFDMSRLNVSATGSGSGLETSIEQVDALTGGALQLRGGVTRSDDGSFAFRDFALRGDHVSVTADGSATPERADAKVRAVIDDLAKIDQRASGEATVTADFSGTLDDLGVKAVLSVPKGMALDKTLSGIEVTVDATDVTGETAGTLTLAGALDGRAVKGGGRLKTEPSGLRRIEGLDLAIASTTVTGDLAVTPAGLANGTLAFASPDLAEIGALALTDLAGAIKGDVKLSTDGGAQRAVVKLDGSDIAAPGAKVGSLAVNATVTDPAGRLTIDGTANGSGVVAGGQVIDSLAVVAKGAPDGMDVDLDMESKALGSSAKAAARVAYAARETRVELRKLDLTGGGKAASLAGPAEVRLRDGKVDIAGFSLRTREGGALDISGEVGDELRLALGLRDLPLALGNAFTPGLDLSGLAKGDALVTGRATQPTVAFNLSVADLSVAKLRDARVPPLTVVSSGLVEGPRVGTRTTVTGAGGLNVAIDGSAPIGEGDLDMRVRVKSLPIALANAFQPELGFGGRIEADATVTGPVRRPNGTYRARISDFTSTRARGVAPISVEASGQLQGERVTTDAKISGGGGVRAAARGFVPLGRGDVDMTVEIAEIPLAIANAFAPDFGLGGALKGAVKVAGPIDAPRGTYDLSISDLKTAKARDVPPLAVSARGRLEGRTVTTDASVTGGGGIGLTAVGSAPLGPGDVDMFVSIRELPLSIANAVKPELGLGGVARGDVRISGPIDAPRGNYSLKVSDLVAAPAKGLPALQIDARGALEGARVTTLTSVTGGGLDLSAAGAAPIGEGDLDMTVTVREAPLALANPFLPEAGLGGMLRGSAKITGPVKAPAGTYDVTVSDLTSAQARGVAALLVVARGGFDARSVTTDAAISGGGGVQASAKGSAPIGQGDLDMAVALKAFPIAIVNAFKPELGLGGVAQGEARLTGPVDAPVGTYALTVTDVTSAQARSVPPLQVATRGELKGASVTTDTSITGAGGISLQAQGSAPVGEGDLDMKVAIRELPVALANGFRPELGLAGVLRGDASVAGSIKAPRGTYDLTIADLTSRQAVGVPALQIATKGALEGERVTTDTSVTGGGGIQLTAKGSAPLGDGELDMAVMIREVPLALANAFKSDLGLAGVLKGDAKVSGPIKAPRGTYDLAVTGLTSAQAKGVPALEIATKGTLEGDRVTTDTTLSGGGGVSLTAKGSAPLGKGDVDMAVAIREVPLAIANAIRPALGLGGKLKGDVKVSGAVTAPQGTYDLSVENLTAAQAKGVPPLQIASKGTLEGSRVTTDTSVTGGGGVRLTAKGAAPIGDGDLDMAVDIAEVPLSIANGFSPGLGLGGKLAGSAKATGKLTAPNGTYDLRVTGLTVAAAKGVPPLQVASKGQLGGGRVTTDTEVTGGGGMRVTANGSAPLGAGPLDVAVRIASVPVALANGFSPGLGAQGALTGDAKIGGTVAAPAGTYQLKVTGLSTTATRGAGVPAAAIDSRGRLEGKRIVTDTVVTAPSGMRVTASGSAPLGAGDLDLKVAGRAPLAFLNDTLSVSGDRVDGAVTFDVKVGGPTTGPRINGSGGLQNASYSNRASGLQLRGMSAAVSANGTNVEVTSLRATTRNGGSITGSGRVQVNPAAGFPGQINFRAQNAEVVGTDIVTAITDADLRLEGPLARRPVVRGTIRTRSIEVQIPDRIPAAYTPIPDLKHRNAPAAVARQIKVIDAGKGKSGVSDAFLATLDIDVRAENRIFIRGMGMQAEAGGQIKISGTSANPVPVGNFELRRGRSSITVIGKRLEFTRGQLGFAGELDPTLDFLAETPAKGLTAQVVISGNASRPKIEFTSNPVVPQDEVLARLLFDKSSGELSTSQALTIAQAVAQYSGVGGGGAGPLEGLRKGLGVDTLDIAAGDSGPGLGVGKYISDNIYLGVRSGTTPESTGVTVDIDLTKNIKARGMAGSAGNTSAGVAVEWDY